VVDSEVDSAPVEDNVDDLSVKFSGMQMNKVSRALVLGVMRRDVVLQLEKQPQAVNQTVDTERRTLLNSSQAQSRSQPVFAIPEDYCKCECEGDEGDEMKKEIT